VPVEVFEDLPIALIDTEESRSPAKAGSLQVGQQFPNPDRIRPAWAADGIAYLHDRSDVVHSTRQRLFGCGITHKLIIVDSSCFRNPAGSEWVGGLGIITFDLLFQRL
jgi:hypothetical protein